MTYPSIKNIMKPIVQAALNLVIELSPERQARIANFIFAEAQSALKPDIESGTEAAESAPKPYTLSLRRKFYDFTSAPTIAVIKAVRNVRECTLMKAKELVDQALMGHGIVLKYGMSQDELDKAIRVFEEMTGSSDCLTWETE